MLIHEERADAVLRSCVGPPQSAAGKGAWTGLDTECYAKRLASGQEFATSPEIALDAELALPRQDGEGCGRILEIGYF